MISRQNSIGKTFDVIAQRHSEHIEKMLIKLGTYAKEKLGVILETYLDHQELSVQREINQLEFKGGMWYRPWHNQFVPTVGLIDIIANKLERDLIFVAQSHDVGYSFAEVAPTSCAGLGWDNLDLRRDHMKIGADFITKRLPDWTGGQITSQRIVKLAEIVAHHDDPYIGAEIPEDKEHKIFRDWDRSFVPSSLNWIKDLLGYAVDQSFSAKVKEAGITLNLSGMMQLRLASFFASDAELPPNWDKAAQPLQAALSAFSPSGLEKQRTDFGQKVAHLLFEERLKDLKIFNTCQSLQTFEDRLIESVDREIALLQGMLSSAAQVLPRLRPKESF